jgi:hypothetical protein
MHIHLSAAVVSALLSSACCPKRAVVVPIPEQPAPTEPTPGEPTPPEPTPVEPTTPEPAPAALEGKRHSLSILGPAAVEVAVGDLLTFTFEQHASVGRYAEWDLGDAAIVAFVRQDTLFKNPDNVAAGMTGADAASATFWFRAVAPGTTTLTLRNMFRGQPENTIDVNVTVR